MHDVVGLGENSIDYVYRLPVYPRPNGPLSKVQIAAAQGGYVQSGPVPAHRDAPKVGRNDPCPCGSGKKFKHCHGQLS